MVFQIFQSHFSIIYIEGDNQIIAHQLLQENNYTNQYKYIGEFLDKESIYNQFPGIFIDGFKYDSYINFIKTKGLVNLMKNYWDSVIEQQHDDTSPAQKLKLKQN